MKFSSDQDWCDVPAMRAMTAAEYRAYIEQRIDAASGVLAHDGGPPLACTDEQLEILSEYVRRFVGRLVR